MQDSMSIPLIELTKKIAFFLNEGEHTEVWEFRAMEEPYPTQYIRKVNNPECELAIHVETYGASKGRIEVHGNFHLATGKNAMQNKTEFVDVREWNGSERTALPKITISGTKTPQQMATDIKRRFLPEYLPLFEKAVARRDSQRDYRTKQLERMKEFAPLVHADLTRTITEDRDRFSFSHLGAYGDVEVYSESANLKLSSVPFDKAKRILSIMGE